MEAPMSECERCGRAAPLRYVLWNEGRVGKSGWLCARCAEALWREGEKDCCAAQPVWGVVITERQR